MKLLHLMLVAICPIFFTNIYFGQDTLSNEPSSSLLWEITGKKVKSPSYLFGTMHLIPTDRFLFPESLQKKIKNSEVLVMEIGGLAEQMKGMELLMLKEGNLFDYFSEEQADSIFTFAKEQLGYDEQQMRTLFGKMKPFALMQLMTQRSFGENPASYELSMEKLAREHEITVLGLETAEEQMSLFDSIPVEKQVEMVMSSLRSVDESSEETNKLIDAYLSQNIDTIYSYISSSPMNTDSFEQDFLIQRNQKWIPEIKKIIKKEKAFIAVGAAHLG
ncbi:MAG: TraB/GumN family protein, partial [Brumimicrobium sp.]|nr:TraB/GumN family protein [Brumimicrobium sp.]